MKQVAVFKTGPVYEYTIENEVLKLTALNFGATITGIYIKEDQHFENMVTSFQDIMDYERQGGPYLNAIVGPVAGRIAYGSYKMNEEKHHLSVNNGLHHLHGGASGISKKNFTVREDGDTLHFHMETTHDEDGFPKGTYTYDVSYRLCGNQLTISYCGIPPVLSLMNMTSHLYFNLSGDMKDSICTHDIYIPSVQKEVIHSDGHPYKIEDIKKGSAFDFSTMRNIGDNYKLNDPEFAYTKAFDTPFLLEKKPILLYHKNSERLLRIQSDSPCVVMYTANYFDEALLWQNGTHGYPMCAVALETQDIANGVNIPHCSAHPFSDKKHPYHQTTTYTFDIKSKRRNNYGNNQRHCG